MLSRSCSSLVTGELVLPHAWAAWERYQGLEGRRVGPALGLLWHMVELAPALTGAVLENWSWQPDDETELEPMV